MKFRWSRWSSFKLAMRCAWEDRKLIGWRWPHAIRLCARVSWMFKPVFDFGPNPMTLGSHGVGKSNGA